MNVIAAIVVSAGATSAAPAPPTCLGCTLDAPSSGDAIPMLVMLRGEHDAAPRGGGSWRAPALGNGWAVLTLADWETSEPSWIAAQVRVAAKVLPIDLARVYLIGSSDGAAYIARHVQELSDTFAALVITGGGGLPATNACPAQILPVYFLVEAGDPGARDLRGYLERCKQPIVWTVLPGLPRGATDARTGITRGGAGSHDREHEREIDQKTVRSILDWLHRHVRVTTVAIGPPTARPNEAELICDNLASCSRGATCPGLSGGADLDRPRRHAGAAVPALHARGPHQVRGRPTAARRLAR